MLLGKAIGRIVWKMRMSNLLLKICILERGLEARRCMTVVQVMYYVVHAIYLMGLYKHSQYVDKSITQKSVDRENIKKEMKHLTSDERCRNVIRMGLYAFAKLVELLRESGRLHDTKRAIVKEQIAKFLHILNHNVKTRTVSFFF